LWCIGKKVNGYVADPVDNELWVHSGCMKPSRPVFEAVTLNRIPRGATGINSVYGRGDGVNEITFAHPEGKRIILTVMSYHRRPHAMTLVAPQTDILLNTWKRLDVAVAMLEETQPNSPQYQILRGKCVALAEVLADMMPPFFTTSREIADEARRRYSILIEGGEPATPGLGVEALAEFERQPVQHGVLTPATAGSAPVAISEEVANNIRKGLASGLFTPAQLASSYKVPVAAVEALRTS
jgi:hypothetical protein